MKYKKTGIDWMPEVPIDWTVTKLKYIGEAIIGLTYSPTEIVGENEGMLVLRASNIQEGEFSTNDCVFIKKEIPEKLLTKKGDILLCARNGSVALVGKNIMIDEATENKTFGAFMTVFRSDYNDYLKHFFNSQIFKAKSSSFATTTVNQLTHHILMNMQIAFPSDVIERNKIVSFLDTQSAKITRFIQSKQRFIDLLKEQRQSIITQAVTKGLNYDSDDFCDLPDSPKNHNADKVKMKETVLGKIPQHWEVRRLKFCLIEKLKYGANVAGDYYNPAWYRYIRITDFTSEGTLDENNKLSLSIEDGKGYELKDGDILLARSGATVGKSFQFKVDDQNEKCCYAGYLIKASPNEELVLSDFLYNFTLTSNYENWKSSILIKATIENISAEKYANLLIPIPPLSEQQQIVEHIKTETRSLDIAISKAEREIELIKEYREAMIAEAVTGKMSEL